MTEMMERGVGVNVRSFEMTEFDFADEGSNGFTFEGRASVVDTPYTVRDQYGTFEETIKRGGFTKTLSDGGDVALFVNHNQLAPPLATRAAGTLELAADPHLDVRAQLDPARPDVQILKSAVDRREMSQMSIGFRVPAQRDQWNEAMDERVITEVALVETSVVWQGASPTTTAAMRTLQMLGSLDAYGEDELMEELRRRGYEVEIEELERHSVDLTAMMLELHRRRPGI